MKKLLNPEKKVDFEWSAADEGRGRVIFTRSERDIRGLEEKLLGAVDTRKCPRAENRVWSDQEDHEKRGSKDRAASTCGPHSDSFNDTSRRKRSNCPTNNFETPCRSKS
ncbi:hypothetical protein TNCV_5060101 [Trichonephila clavipes]|nr:hypothetical protein TNCV_5060101 [Trichonephila clavipes]